MIKPQTNARFFSKSLDALDREVKWDSKAGLRWPSRIVFKMNLSDESVDIDAISEIFWAEREK